MLLNLHQNLITQIRTTGKLNISPQAPLVTVNLVFSDDLEGQALEDPQKLDSDMQELSFSV